MSWIREIAPADAQGRLGEIYSELSGRRGKIANILQVHSLRPEALATHLALYMDLLFAPGGLSRKQREMIAVVVSRVNQCEYCVAHHVEPLRRHFHDESELAAFAADYRQVSLLPADRALLDYAARLTLNPASIDGQAIHDLRAHQFPDEDILLANLITAYFNFVNRIALGLGVRTNPEEVGGYRS